jgi:hypothetical protein
VGGRGLRGHPAGGGEPRQACARWSLVACLDARPVRQRAIISDGPVVPRPRPHARAPAYLPMLASCVINSSPIAAAAASS